MHNPIRNSVLLLGIVLLNRRSPGELVLSKNNKIMTMREDRARVLTLAPFVSWCWCPSKQQKNYSWKCSSTFHTAVLPEAPVKRILILFTGYLWHKINKDALRRIETHTDMILAWSHSGVEIILLLMDCMVKPH